MATTAPIVCSFHTPDAYYSGHAARLRGNLERLGIEHEIRETVKEPGQDWADICRRKVAFLAEVCEANPDRPVFWIDVDCALLALPEWVMNFSSDLIGFQRGFASPLTIGYGRRTRFWEPCFFGIAASERGRRFIRDAAALEAVSDLKATDDYFFEEAWRADASAMSFQVIPSTAVVSPQPVMAGAERPFFAFGSSGKVAEFKGQVAQHSAIGGQSRVSLAGLLRRSSLGIAKRVERALPATASRTLRRLADSAGITALLTGGTFGAGALATGSASPERRAAVATMLSRAQSKDVEGMQRQRRQLETRGVVTDAERSAMRAAESFAHYATTGAGEPVTLAWWPRPFPGNLGDWLSPLLVQHVTGRPVRFQPPTAKTADPHLVALGSIGRFVKRSSVVVGTGVSSQDVELAPRARWVSVRGPLTAQALRDSGGPEVERFGDPGVLIRRAIPLVRGETNGRIALVRHFTHLGLPLVLPDDVDELSVLASHPDDVTALMTSLVRYDRVVTSAMHVMISCHSYGIPCALVTFEGMEDAVHGSGIKYEDYALGVDIKGLRGPQVIAPDLPRAAIDDATLHIELGDALLDDVQAAVSLGAQMLSNPAVGQRRTGARA